MVSAFSFSVSLSLDTRSFRGAAIDNNTSYPSRCGVVQRRIPARMCAEDITSSSSKNEPRVVDGEYDELKSDEDYIVVDGKDVSALIRAMQQSGEDALLALEDEPESTTGTTQGGATTTSTSTSKNGEKQDEEIPEKEQAVMEYFTEENLSHMPKWAREAYKLGNHSELEEASRLMEKKSQRRLHLLAESSGTNDTDDDTKDSVTDISDCRVCDVAEDYDVPVEFVCDVLLELGVKSPRLDDAISARCNREEIGTLLHLISSFDSKDLSDRYSDRTLAELAEDYDLDLEAIEQLCADEQIYCAKGESTRLQVTREDRILDILMNDFPLKKPYPSLLEGLLAAAA